MLRKKRIMSWGLLLATAAALLTGCGQSHAQELTKGMESAAQAGDYGSAEAQAVTGFGVQLLQQAYQAGEEGENFLLSPLSAAYALGMTANGAQGRTLEQMEQVLGLPADRLGQGLGGYLAQTQGEEQLRLANSLWLNEKEAFQPRQTFLEKAVGQYQAQVYQGPFDDETRKQINRWVSKKTEGMIPVILRELKSTDVMILLNALCFDAKWEEPYQKAQIRQEEFATEAGEKRQAQMMYSSEEIYWELEGGQGFLKPYAGGQYAFAALLPPEGTSMADFLPLITGEGLAQALEAARMEEIRAAIPQFKCQGDYRLDDFLKELGMTDAFDSKAADFSSLGASEDGPIYVDRALQKTYIEVNNQGTKAAAVTAVAPGDGAAPQEPKQIYEIYLERPFLYLLLDRRTNTPLMMGVTMDVAEAA